jgi:hypothetical protein
MERPQFPKKVAHKVLRYFPVIPRLQRMFVSKEMSTHTRWHKEKRVVEKGVLRHPADGKVWKHFDKKFGWLAADPCNIKLGIATDGFNPYGHMASNYTMWLVFVILYNFPPLMCMYSSNHAFIAYPREKITREGFSCVHATNKRYDGDKRYDETMEGCGHF